MLVRSCRWLTVIVLALGLFLGSGEIRKAEAKGKHHKKVGFFTKMKRKIKRKIKRVCKKIRRGVVNAGHRVQNRIMDSGVKLKSRITGKKPKRVWVCGHYKKGKRHSTKGHFRRVNRKGKPGSGGSNPGQGGFAPAPAPAPSTPPTSIAGGSPLPPIDPVLPSMSKHYKSKSKSHKAHKSHKSHSKKRR